MAKHSIALIVIGGHEDKKGQRDVLRAISEGLSGGQLIIATIASPAREGYFAGYCDASDDSPQNRSRRRLVGSIPDSPACAIR